MCGGAHEFWDDPAQLADFVQLESMPVMQRQAPPGAPHQPPQKRQKNSAPACSGALRKATPHEIEAKHNKDFDEMCSWHLASVRSSPRVRMSPRRHEHCAMLASSTRRSRVTLRAHHRTSFLQALGTVQITGGPLREVAAFREPPTSTQLASPDEAMLLAHVQRQLPLSAAAADLSRVLVTQRALAFSEDGGAFRSAHPLARPAFVALTCCLALIAVGSAVARARRLKRLG